MILEKECEHCRKLYTEEEVDLINGRWLCYVCEDELFHKEEDDGSN